MKNVLVVAVALAAVVFVGCRAQAPTLTPDGAKRLLQERFRAEDQVTGLISYAPVAALMSHVTLVDYAQEGFVGDNPDAAMHRLLYAGLVTQTAETRSFHFGRSGGSGHVLTAYRYGPTPQLLESVVSLLAGPVGRTRVRMLKAGEMEVDKVDNLTFNSRASATCQFTWHVDYNAAGRAISGSDGDRGVGQARFNKQTGVWVCVRP